ncbi:MAG: ABC transporter transmembrane domain-containing protein [Acidimicrobiia bacterium]|nr:ABC transporter transmembrane domain-containing protein [Acidimicrobiia bacterium]
MSSDSTTGRRPERLFTVAAGPLRGAVLLALVRALLAAGAALAVGALVDGVADGGAVTGALVVLGVLVAARALLAMAGPLLATTIATRVERRLRRRVLDAVLDVGPWTGRRTGEVVGRATEGIDAVGALAGTFLPQLVGGMVVPLGLIAVVAVVDWPTALVLAVLLPLVPLLLRLLERRFASVSARYRATADELAARFLDGIQGLRTLKSLDRSEAYGDELARASDRLRSETMALLRVNQLALLAVDSLFTLGTVVAAAVMAGWRLSSGAITVGEAVALVILGVLLIEPLTGIGRFFYVGAIGRAAAAQVRELLALESSDPGADDPSLPPGAVRVRSVGYAYDDGTEALSDVSFEVAPGERVALVGPSGAGKTTLAHLLLGLLEPARGSVGVGGRSVLVSQRPFLFHGTVAENLRLADPDASDDDLWAVLRAADLAAVVEARAGGLDGQIGERGLQLSGGEAQRLAIARALLADADVVVLDEPTSNVDLETEARIRQALDRLMEGRTVVVIAHRRSTIAGMDRVVALEGGRMTAGGPT